MLVKQTETMARQDRQTEAWHLEKGVLCEESDNRAGDSLKRAESESTVASLAKTCHYYHLESDSCFC